MRAREPETSRSRLHFVLEALLQERRGQIWRSLRRRATALPSIQLLSDGGIALVALSHNWFKEALLSEARPSEACAPVAQFAGAAQTKTGPAPVVNLDQSVVRKPRSSLIFMKNIICINAAVEL